MKDTDFYIKYYYCSCYGGRVARMKTLDNEPSPMCNICGSNMREVTEDEFRSIRGWHTDKEKK